MFALVVTCNTFFNIFGSTDGGIWRRIKVVEFMTKFVEEDETNIIINKPYVIDNESVCLKDINLAEKIDTWKEAFLYRLVQIAFRTNGIVKDCESIKQKTDEYRFSQNRIQQFFEQKCVMGENLKVSKAILIDQFKHFYDKELSLKARPKELFTYLEHQEGITLKNETYYGLECTLQYVEVKPKDVKSDKDIFMQEFNRVYEVSLDLKDNYVISTDIEKWAKSKKLNIRTSVRINKILEDDYLLDASIHRTQKRVEVEDSPDKVQKYVWFCIKKRDVPLAITPVKIETNKSESDSESEDNVTPSVAKKLDTVFAGGASIKSDINEEGCSGCNLSKVCKCDAPDYKKHKQTGDLYCMHCHSYKCKCSDFELSDEEVNQEVFEKEINGKKYYVTNETDGAIYECLSDEDVGDEIIGEYQNGVANFYEV